MNLGTLKIHNKNIFAPMDMYSDSAFRQLCLDYGASYCFTELTSTAGFVRKAETFKRKVDLKTEVGLQFISNNKNELKESIRIVKDNEFYDNLENVKSIDLNLGCPSIKMMEQNMGSALLNQPHLIRELFQTMKKHSHLPISAKIRLATNSKHKKQSQPYLRIAKIAKEEGLDFITIHGRTAGQMYEGDVDIEAIKEVKEKVDIPLIGNGNIFDKRSAKEFDFCDAIMIGRQALKDPFIFGELKGKEYDFEREKIKCIKNYLIYAKKFDTGFQHIKIHLQSLLKGLEGRKDIIRELTHTKTVNDINELLKTEL